MGRAVKSLPFLGISAELCAAIPLSGRPASCFLDTGGKRGPVRKGLGLSGYRGSIHGIKVSLMSQIPELQCRIGCLGSHLTALGLVPLLSGRCSSSAGVCYLRTLGHCVASLCHGAPLDFSGASDGRRHPESWPAGTRAILEPHLTTRYKVAFL